jgi:subtilisin family serine protease/subtilisin-like proprotein convertase family protein
MRADLRDGDGARKLLSFKPVNLHLLAAATAFLTLQAGAANATFRLPSAKEFSWETRKSATDSAWIEATEKGSTNTWWFGSHVVVEATGNPTAAVAGLGLEMAEIVRPNLVIFRASSAAAALDAAAIVSGRSGVVSAYPVCRQPAALGYRFAAAPNDDFFPSRVANVSGQWYLENRDPASGAALGPDLNVRSAWPTVRGRGVTVGIGDVGVELTHPELAQATTNQPHFNFARTNSSGGPVSFDLTGTHGTSCAGLVAARDNNQIGMSGVAPEARLASLVVFDANRRLATDRDLAAAYRHASNQVAIQNHSWGNAGDPQAGPTSLERAGLEDAFRLGRRGLGTVMVRIAGNRRAQAANANDDGWANDPRAICVAAIRPNGRAATYSNPGASILVSAPGGDNDIGGLFTTDLSGFAGANFLGFLPPFEYLSDFRFNSLGMIGTSAAAPLVSGTVALILEANPAVTVRDVQQIVLLSAQHFDLEDPSLHTNGVGLVVSHNTGFGVTDAGAAVRLAEAWSNRPAATVRSFTNAVMAGIPDDSLRVEVSGTGIPAGLASIRCLPGTGPFADEATEALPLVDIGRATNTIGTNLAGRAALIERGDADFVDKLRRASAAGAAFAVVYNYAVGSTNGCPPGDQLCPMGGTDFAPIPAVFIGNSDGVALRTLTAANTSARVRLAQNPARISFAVPDALSCEHVQVRVRTDHPLRGDLRLTLTSPKGTRSVLQSYNSDVSAGPADWTYMSTHHFFEPTAGVWTLAVSDLGPEAVGRVLGVTLLIHGVPITDADANGLDDAWERSHFGQTGVLPAADADGDGFSNVREFVMGTDPRVVGRRFEVQLAEWKPGLMRLSWSARPGSTNQVLAGATPLSLTGLTNLPVRGDEGSLVVSTTNRPAQFFQLPDAAAR